VEPPVRAATPLLWALGACSGSGDRRSVDVLVITVDTLRHDVIDAPGYAELAARGTRFTEATTPFPRTTPALASMWTGLLPARHGSQEVGEPVKHGVSVVRLFQEAGYTTLAMSGSGVAGPKQGLDDGFEVFEVVSDPRAHAGADLARDLLPWSPDGPVLLWVHLTDPHFPYLPEEALDAPVCRELGERAADRELSRAAVFGDRDGVSSMALEDCRVLYAAEAAAAADQISGLVDALDDPVVVLTSDHGEALGEWGLFYEHGPHVHDSAVRVPLLVAGPGVPEGETRETLVQLQDVGPTLLRLAGLPVPEDLDGQDLFEAPPRDHVAAVSGSALHPTLTGVLRAGRASKRNCLHVTPYSLCTDGFFDHQADPTHRTDLTGTLPLVEGPMARAAEAWPAERARQLMVRTATHKLVATPWAFGVQHNLYALPDEDTPVRDTRLEAELRALLPSQPGEGEEGDEEALRALGYVE